MKYVHPVLILPQIYVEVATVVAVEITVITETETVTMAPNNLLAAIPDQALPGLL